MTLAGIDGCRGGWLCVVERGGVLTATITATLAAWLAAERPDLAVIDIPIGLTEADSRECDVLARQALPGRASSIFPAPVRGALGHDSYAAACAAHRACDGRAMSKQAWFILPKIAEVDALLQADPQWRAVLHEGHPELSFATWNGGRPMVAAKRTLLGRLDRRSLIEGRWPGRLEALAESLPRAAYQADDLLDACAVLWTADRLSKGKAVVRPAAPAYDETGLRMSIVA